MKGTAELYDSYGNLVTVKEFGTRISLNKLKETWKKRYGKAFRDELVKEVYPEVEVKEKYVKPKFNDMKGWFSSPGSKVYPKPHDK